MRTPAEIAALRAACESWQGTPFCPNSAVKGAGVCGHKFCGAACMESGLLPVFAMPDGYPYGSDTATVSPFETYLDACPHFTDGDPARLAVNADRLAVYSVIQPCDLILSKPGRLPWHLAIYLGGTSFAHVDLRHGVQISDALPDLWLKRVVRVYRPN